MRPGPYNISDVSCLPNLLIMWIITSSSFRHVQNQQFLLFTCLCEFLLNCKFTDFSNVVLCTYRMNALFTITSYELSIVCKS